MKTKMILMAVCALALVGCITKNPNYDAAKPTTGDNTPYVTASGKAVAIIDRVKAANDATAPVNPYAGLIDAVLGVIGGGIAAGSTLLAKVKNAKATADNATSAAKIIAQNLPANLVQQTIESSPTPQVAGLVAAHLQSVS